MHGEYIISGYLTAINVLTFSLMVADKVKAIKNSRRIPEIDFIILSILGGSPAAIAAMYIFRHKIKHFKFIVGIPCILVIQVACIVYFLYH